jgi:septal ring factor EnvC (AmiA/AmiB activator)
MTQPRLALGLAVAFACWPAYAGAQENVERQIRANQERLEAIRRARRELEAELERIRGRAHSLANELANIERQKAATSRLINELDRQIGSLSASLDTATIDLALTEDALTEKRAVLERRLGDIYKRGPLWSFQVLLASESFADLLSRYKYLYLVSRQDRALVDQVSELRDRIASQRSQLLAIRRELAARREERSRELERYLALERQRERSLRLTRASEREASARLDSLSRDERRLNDAIAALERSRRAAAARTLPSPAGTGITHDDLGRLDWPVEGELIYRFGPYRLPNNTVVRQNGIGIRVPEGTPVRAVAAGIVRMAEPFGTYGPTVTLDHGGGFYTLYLYLSSIEVSLGQQVAKGQIIGRSGGGTSDHGPHLEFQIRGEGAIALDPLNWLKPQR